MSTQPEYWLRGPIEQIPSLLQPVAHALLQARDEVKEALIDFPEKELWQKPAGVASVGFHLQHLAGVLDRLFTYARGEQLSNAQSEYLSAEGKENTTITVAALIIYFSRQVDISLLQLKATDEKTLIDARGVGRKQVPTTIMGLLFHAAEHTQRHTGQLLVTARIVSVK